MSDVIAHSEHTARLIRHGQLQVDDSRVQAVADAGEVDVATIDSLPADEPGWIVPLATWTAHRDTLRARRHPVAVLLAPDSKLQELVNDDGEIDPTGIDFIAIDFPVYTDGRGYSLAQLLRTRYGWQGELRAVGDVMIDTIHYQARVGFDSFLVKPGHDPHKALAAFQTFTVHYQKTYPKPSVPVEA
ncbi:MULTISPECIES: DUF934 domain-containing protein [unclassified Bordetella]|uniref:DUF934 domain-containing protein n=1 Tax=unclassified Bordetella TaxID=2630031 RepID=UPI001324967A|nr:MULTISPECIES: DUF934 domain-containing protein [unclassified Bordetella]MVW72013.1 DUF934 domain-containing protein [Bordetella sp. 15P40C-2]MVW79269.1 DUF934 domain-containing protein [Bordetella sp. 02P26C-1]